MPLNQAVVCEAVGAQPARFHAAVCKPKALGGVRLELPQEDGLRTPRSILCTPPAATASSYATTYAAAATAATAANFQTFVRLVSRLVPVRCLPSCPLLQVLLSLVRVELRVLLDQTLACEQSGVQSSGTGQLMGAKGFKWCALHAL